MNWFKSTARLEKRCKTLETHVEKLLDERERLTDSNLQLKTDLKEVQHKKKIEEEEIRHLIKIREEKADIVFEKKDIKREGEKAKEISKVKSDYQDKIIKNLEKRGEEIKDMYTQILKRLPDVNVMLGNSKED